MTTNSITEYFVTWKTIHGVTHERSFLGNRLAAEEFAARLRERTEDSGNGSLYLPGIASADVFELR